MVSEDVLQVFQVVLVVIEEDQGILQVFFQEVVVVHQDILGVLQVVEVFSSPLSSKHQMSKHLLAECCTSLQQSSTLWDHWSCSGGWWLVLYTVSLSLTCGSSFQGLQNHCLRHLPCHQEELQWTLLFLFFLLLLLRVGSPVPLSSLATAGDPPAAVLQTGGCKQHGRGSRRQQGAKETASFHCPLHHLLLILQDQGLQEQLLLCDRWRSGVCLNGHLLLFPHRSFDLLQMKLSPKL